MHVDCTVSSSTIQIHIFVQYKIVYICPSTYDTNQSMTVYLPFLKQAIVDKLKIKPNKICFFENKR